MLTASCTDYWLSCSSIYIIFYMTTTWSLLKGPQIWTFGNLVPDYGKQNQLIQSTAF